MIYDEITLQVTWKHSIYNYKATFSRAITTSVKNAAESATNMKQTAKDAGATGLIVKPFTPDRFVALVERVIAAYKG